MKLKEYLGLRAFSASPTESKGFIGRYRASMIALALNAEGRSKEVISDKLIFEAVLSRFGFPTPAIQATFDRLHYADSHEVICETKHLRDFLKHRARFPIFIKPQFGQNSLHTFRVDGFDEKADAMVLTQSAPMTLEALHILMRSHIGYNMVMMQDCVEQHSDITALVGPTLATFRIVTFRHEHDYKIQSTFWKLPGSGMVADNFWRGGRVAGIDLKTGRLSQVWQGGNLVPVKIQEHPETGASFNDFTIPHWEDACNTACRAARLFPSVPLIGWDVGITKDGPMIIEANSMPSLELGQLASGLGVFSGEQGQLLRMVYKNRRRERWKYRILRARRRLKLARGYLFRNRPIATAVHGP